MTARIKTTPSFEAALLAVVRIVDRPLSYDELRRLAADCDVEAAEVERLIACCDASLLQERPTARGEYTIQ
jgi:hypothetical protein